MLFSKGLFFCCLLTIVFICCQEGNTVIKVPRNLPPLPIHDSLPISQKGVHLGRLLFYDPILSSDSTISCGSCHHLDKFMSDAGHQFSKGFQGKFSKRNTIGLLNLNYAQEFNWDGGTNSLERQALSPITNPFEMNSDLAVVVARLNASNKYLKLFKSVFQKDSVTTKQLIAALGMFERTFLSANSSYDKFLSNGTQLSNKATKGLTLFTSATKGNCVSCHKIDNALFTDFSYRNNGIVSSVVDSGRYLISRNRNDFGKFKVPSLRNVAATAPYMHDGSMTTLAEVLQHYNSDLHSNQQADIILRTNEAGRLSIEEQNCIIEFLTTLTDSSFAQRKDLGSPY
jgi:cytochrome c peroxidase